MTEDVSVQRILCAVDFYENTKRTTDYALHLASCSGAQVVLLYVAQRMNRYARLYVEQEDLEKVTNSIVSGAQKQMDELIKGKFNSVNAMGMVKMGYPPETILETIEKEHIDMVVMGTHGRRGIDDIFFGSVAEHVVKRSKAPVLTVRPL